jgi:iron complex outermembrane receptor protein
LLFASGALAQPPDNVSSPGALKKLSLEELMDIEVTSVSRRPEKLSDTASAIQVITQEDIRRSGATSLPEALRLASNLAVAQRDSRQWAISARGFNSTASNKLLVMIDGRAVYTPLFAGVFWDVQDTLLEDIDRIEVISGPGATAWGSNAVNGIINVITKKAQDTQGTLLLAGGGSEVHGFGGIRYGGTSGSNLRYRAYGKYVDRGSTVLPNGSDAVDDWHTGQGGFRMDWDASAGDLFTVQGDLYNGQIAQPTADDVDVRGGNLIGRWSRTISDDSHLQLQLYYDRTHRDIPGSFREDLDTYDVDLQHRFPWGARHDVVWGLGYRLINDRIGNSSALAFFPAEVTQTWVSAFGQDEIALVENRLHLTLGTKIEHNGYSGVEVQPSVRLAWRFSDRHTLWSAVSRAVRTPSRIDREFFAPGSPPFLLAGGPDFESEELIAYELGYRAQPLARLAVAVATYYHDYDDLRSLEQVSPPAPFPVVIGNGLEGRSYGAELTADYRATDNWRLRAGYTELRIDIDPKPGSTDTTQGSGESHDPKHQFSLRSSLDLPGKWTFDVGFRAVSDIENQQVPGYSEVDARVGWEPARDLELSLVGQNLLHDRHPEFGTSTARREIERGVYGKIAWRY